jgi:hypothetical protein
MEAIWAAILTGVVGLVTLTAKKILHMGAEQLRQHQREKLNWQRARSLGSEKMRYVG